MAETPVPPAHPRRWDDLLGQTRAVAMLRVAVSRPPHALLFIGDQGATLAAARLFARAAICDGPGPDPCWACPQCALSDHPDFHLWDVNAGEATFKVEAVRNLTAAVTRRPFQARRQVHVVAAADAMQPAGANALLKTLEEPPPTTVVVLCSRTLDALLPTILSRCQVVPFAPVAVPLPTTQTPWPSADDIGGWSDRLATGNKEAQQGALAYLLASVHGEAVAATDDVTARAWLARAAAIEAARTALERHANARLVFDQLGRALSGG